MTDNKIWLIVGAVVAAFAVGAGLYYWTSGDEAVPEQVAEAPPAEISPPQEVEPEGGAIMLPPLAESDEAVRRLVAALSSNPQFASWLVTDDLVRRFVVAVENVAEGSNPSQRLPFLKPNERLGTVGADVELRIDPASYARYNRTAAIVESVDAAGSAELYHTIRPLIDEAYRELGHPEGGFDATLERAIRHLLETPIVERLDPRLVPRSIFLEYADEDLESLTPIQKQLLAMGPDNVRIVQAKLRELAAALGIPADRIPTPVVLR